MMCMVFAQNVSKRKLTHKFSGVSSQFCAIINQDIIICDEVDSSRSHPYHREPLMLEGGIYDFCEVHYGATTGHSDIDDRVGYIFVAIWVVTRNLIRP